MKLEQVNSLSLEEFVRTVGPVFEHSLWIWLSPMRLRAD